MKQILVIITLVAFDNSLQAQTWDEWFRQRKTQKEYLLKQIVALKVFTGYLEKGYKIAREGLSVIDQIKHGDFDLHSGFFESFKDVKPAIRNSAASTDIVKFQLWIAKQCGSALKMLRQSEQFSNGELEYFEKVFTRVMDNCVRGLGELIMLITPGEYAMNDEARMARIQTARNDMSENYRFCRSFSEEARLLALQRLSEQREVQRSRKLFGLY